MSRVLFRPCEDLVLMACLKKKQNAFPSDFSRSKLLPWEIFGNLCIIPAYIALPQIPDGAGTGLSYENVLSAPIEMRTSWLGGNKKAPGPGLKTEPEAL